MMKKKPINQIFSGKTGQFSAIFWALNVWIMPNIFAADPGILKSTVLQNISCDTTQENVFVNIELNQKPIWDSVTVEEHGGFFQVKLPSTTIASPGKFYDCIPGVISKVSGFQMSQDDGAVRIFLDPQTSPQIKKGTGQILDNRLVIVFDNAPTLPIVTSEVNKSQIAPTDTEKSEKILTSAATISPVGKLTSGDFFTRNQKSINKIITASIVLIVAFIFSLLLKPYIKRREKRLNPSSRETDMRVIKSMNLNAKQKITLIQVGEEQLLLSVSNDGVRLIKAIEETPKQRALANISYKESSPRKNTAFTLPEGETNTLTLKKSPFSETNTQRAKEFKYGKEEKFLAGLDDKISIKTNEQSMRPAPRINLKIDDDGVHNAGQKSSNSSEKKIKSIDDVTMLIREKLKDLG